MVKVSFSEFFVYLVTCKVMKLSGHLCGNSCLPGPLLLLVILVVSHLILSCTLVLIVKIVNGFAGVYICFLLFAPKHRLWELVRTAAPRWF